VEVRQAASEESEARGLEGLVGLSLEQIEKHVIRSALRAKAGNREAAAKMLGIGERTLYRKLKEYGLK
jgi:two-component system response regulator HydG